VLIDKSIREPKKPEKVLPQPVGAVHQTTFTGDDMLPGLLLESKRLVSFAGKPLADPFYNPLLFSILKILQT
jgi:hypothetical protein